MLWHEGGFSVMEDFQLNSTNRHWHHDIGNVKERNTSQVNNWNRAGDKKAEGFGRKVPRGQTKRTARGLASIHLWCIVGSTGKAGTRRKHGWFVAARLTAKGEVWSTQMGNLVSKRFKPLITAERIQQCFLSICHLEESFFLLASRHTIQVKRRGATLSSWKDLVHLKKTTSKYWAY